MPTIRRADAADARRVVELVQAAYRGEASLAGWTTEAALLGGQRTSQADVGELLGDARQAILLAEEDGLLLGCCRVSFDTAPPGSAGGARDDRARGHHELGMLAVRPDRQDRGLGRLLVGAAEALVRDEAGDTELRMHVIRQRPELIAWYGRLGYLATGETAPFPYGDERFGLPKRPDLEFVVLAKKIFAAEGTEPGAPE